MSESETWGPTRQHGCNLVKSKHYMPYNMTMHSAHQKLNYAKELALH